MSRDDAPKIVVLTGGPGGGKSTLLRELLGDPAARERWIVLGETPTLLAQAGLDVRTPDFQLAAVAAQVALEDACARAARAGQHMICARGSLDPLAYWLHRGWSEDAFFAGTMSRAAHLRRYAGVIHLQTCAIGAAALYRAFPDGPRRETPAEAAALDGLCAQAWRAHPRFVAIPSAADWRDKAAAARKALAAIVDGRA